MGRLVKPIAVLAAVVRAHDYAYALPSQKRELLLRVARDFHCNIFVETGTFLGDTSHFMAQHGLRCVTIELQSDLAQRARARFEVEPYDITILEGDSSTLLPHAISLLDESALFWLDAHYSSGVTAGSGSAPPLLKELALVLEDTEHDHCIAIDDARDLLGLNGYPDISVVARLVQSSRPDYAIRLVQDIVIVTPARIAQ